MEEIDLKELIQMFLEKKILIISVVIFFAILGGVYTTKLITPMYESSTSLVLVQTGTDNSTTNASDSITTTDITLNSKLIDAYKVIAQSKTIASTVIDNLNLDITIEELIESMSVSSVSESELIITVENKSPSDACKIANEIAKVFTAKVAEIYKVENLYVLDVAEVQEEPCNINLAKNIVIFSFVGAILVAGYILVVNMLDTTVKTDSDIEKALGVPVLASIVLTGDATRKKSKKTKSRKNNNITEDQQIPFSDTVQFFYENNMIDLENEGNEENVSLFSYMNQENLEEADSEHHRKNHKKGGK